MSVNVRFRMGSTHLVVGPSGSGKTFRIAHMLRIKNMLFENGINIKNIVFCYSSWQPLYSQLKEEGIVTKWINKLPSNEEYISFVQPYKDSGGSIVIIDDFMSQINKDLVEIVTVSARHNNATTFLLFQSLFPSNPLARQISLNVKYIHIFKNPRENAQIQFLARQLHPAQYKWIIEAYHQATKNPHSVFMIDLMQDTPENLRFKSNLLPHEAPIRIWIPKTTAI